MKLASSILFLALPLAASSSANNIRGGGGRELSNSDKTSLSGGTWLFYLMLNAVMYPYDYMGYGCNSSSSYTTTTSSKWGDDGNGRMLDSDPSWGDDGYAANTATTSWGNDGSSSWGNDGSHTTTSTSTSTSGRCSAPHAPSKPKPKPKPKKPSVSSSSGGSSSSTPSPTPWADDGHVPWGDDGSSSSWGSDAYGVDGDQSSISSSKMEYNEQQSGGSGGGAMIAVMMLFVVAAVVGVLVAKKKIFQNGIFPSRNRKIASIDANALSDTDDSSDSDHEDVRRSAASSSSYVEMADKQQQSPSKYTPNAFGASRGSGKPPRAQGYTSKLMGMGTPSAAVNLERGGSRLSVGSLD